ncbi:anti-sigma factor [Hymenobacter sp. GOD-10R]|uniref:anti-sigma factor n=1 Tax=Hymenobacter sp. GOD-10R TaxID=3093922 RepID=UPI002D7A1244|nr:anti-sigma factor [Hymenobacter sp. GOD-10R]WRQ26492.1 anti-sigma factor [Hymenobacter sp. GOD-10R]
MNIQEYIESGILEQYALGELDDTQRADVERQAAAYPEVRAELEQIESALGIYGEAHALTPPSGMKERVLAGFHAAIRQDAAPAPTASSPEPVVRQMTAPAAEVEDPKIVPFRVSWSMAAAVALLVLSGAANLVFYNKWKQAETDLVVAQNQQAGFASTVQAVNKTLSYRNQELAVLRSDQFKTVALVGTPSAPGAKARVLYNPTTKAVYLDVRKLPAPPPGKQYQLWALDQGKPVDAGVLASATAAGDSLQQMKNIASAQAFAMTVEKEGGSPTPTLSTMTVIGNI